MSQVSQSRTSSPLSPDHFHSSADISPAIPARTNIPQNHYHKVQLPPIQLFGQGNMNYSQQNNYY